MPKLVKDQVEGVQWIIKNLQKYKGVINADGCGLGKTAQAIAVCKYGAHKYKMPTLIVHPAYLRYNWIEELEMWDFAEDLHVITSLKEEIPPASTYLASYNAVANENILAQLLKKQFHIVVSDEAHALKAWSSDRSLAVLGNFKRTKKTLNAVTKKHLLLTATPILKDIEDLYNLALRIAPQTLAQFNRTKFFMTFAEDMKITPWKTSPVGVKNEDLLKRLLKDVILRRTFIEGLPDKTEKDIIFDVKGPELNKLIKDENEFLLMNGIDPKKMARDLKIGSMDMTHISDVRQKTALLKLKKTGEFFRDVKEKHSKTIFVCYHREVQKEFSAFLKKAGFSHDLINGGLTLKKRKGIIERFQSDQLQHICTTLDALKEGENITEADSMVFLEHDWTPAWISQMIGRIHRRGQQNRVVIYHLLFNNGIDLYIRRTLKRKQSTIDKIL